MHIPEYPQTKGSGCYTLLILLSILSMYIPLRIVFLLSMLFSRSRHLRDSPAVSFHTRHKDQTPFLARVNASSTAVSYITQPILVLCCFFLYFFSYRQERGRWISSLYFFLTFLSMASLQIEIVPFCSRSSSLPSTFYPLFNASFSLFRPSRLSLSTLSFSHKYTNSHLYVILLIQTQTHTQIYIHTQYSSAPLTYSLPH